MELRKGDSHKMNETIRLFDKNAYEIEFDATVISCVEIIKEDRAVYEVVLDQTLFFPEEGGQTPDQGTINNQTVVDVQIQNGIIIHTMNVSLQVGEKIHGMIDWSHRFHNMQQHSGEHIFSGLVHRAYGYDNVGFHLSDQIVTMDFNGPLTMEQASQIEYEANQAIISNQEILVSYPSKKELEQLDYRSKIEIDGQVRIVTIPGVDVCACCAPHVNRTGEIGILKIIDMKNYKGGVRISILCGYRALADYRKKTEIISSLSVMLSANQESVVDSVVTTRNANQLLKQELTQVKKAYLSLKLESIPKNQENIYIFEEDMDQQAVRTVLNDKMQSHEGTIGIFIGNDVDGYRFLIGSLTKDVRILMGALKENLNAKGGGSTTMIQGSFEATKEQVMKILS